MRAFLSCEVIDAAATRTSFAVHPRPHSGVASYPQMYSAQPTDTPDTATIVVNRRIEEDR